MTTYLETARTARPDSKTAVLVEEPLWIEDFHGTVADLDDEQMTEAEDDALDRAGRIQPKPACQRRSRCWSGCATGARHTTPTPTPRPAS